MKKLSILLSLIFLISCGPTKEELNKNESAPQLKMYGVSKNDPVSGRLIVDYYGLVSGIAIYVIDSCEYITVINNGTSIIHKANCKNHKNGKN